MKTTQSTTERGKAREQNTGMTQREIAEMIGCSRSKVHHFETGDKPWNIDNPDDEGRVTDILNWAYSGLPSPNIRPLPNAKSNEQDNSPLEVVEWRVVYAKLDELFQEESPAVKYLSQALELLNQQKKKDAIQVESLMAELAIYKQRDSEWIGTCSVMEGELKERSANSMVLLEQNQTLTLALHKARSESKELSGVQNRNLQLEAENVDAFIMIKRLQEKIKELESLQDEDTSLFAKVFGTSKSGRATSGPIWQSTHKPKD